MSADRPGVMIYFDDTLPALDCLSLEEAGRLFKGMLEYGRSGTLPDFHDSVGLNVAWSFIRKKIDRDNESYEKSILKSKYGVYKREAQKRKEDPLPFDDWYQKIYLPASTNKPPSCPIIDTYVTGTGTGTATATGIGNRNKELEPELQQEQGTGNKSKRKKNGAAAPTPAAAPPESAIERHKYGEYGWVRLSDDEYSRLLEDFGSEELERCITYVDESAQSNGNRNKWKDWNLVVRKCAKYGWGKARGQGTRQSASAGAMDDLQQLHQMFEAAESP